MTYVMMRNESRIYERIVADRSLLPREHGAWAQLGLPLVAAFASGRPSWAAMTFGIAAVCAFLAHEPVRVLLGHRGTKARRIDGARACLHALALGSISAIAGVTALVIAPPHARIVATLVLFACGIVAAIALRNWDRTTIGESVVAAALASASLPVAIASGVPAGEAMLAWCVWAFAFVLCTLAVRTLTSKSEHERRILHVMVLALATAGVVVIFLGAPMAIIATPVILLVLSIVMVRPHNRQLRRVGWAIAASTTIMAISFVIHARSA